MKLANCLSCALAALLTATAFAQDASTKPDAAAKAASDSGAKDKPKAMGKDAKEAKDLKGAKDGDKDKLSDQDGGVQLTAPKGDIIRLKNGKVLEGIRIVRTTPREYQVEVTHGGIPISIPLNQVEKVEYDKHPDSGGSASSDPSVKIIPGQRLSPELDKKLSSTDLAHPPLQFKDEDLVKVLDDLSKKHGVKIVVEQPVKDLDPKERTWTFTAKDGTTLQTFLANDLPAQFKKLAVQFQFDTIVVTTKEAAAKMAPAPGDAKPMPAAAEPAKTSGASK